MTSKFKQFTLEQMQAPKRARNVVGETFNYLTVVEYAGKNRHNQVLWRSRCVCGNEVVCTLSNLTQNNTKSCGCKWLEAHMTHGHKRNIPGKTWRGSKTYNTWVAMKHRCYNPKNKHFKDYGGRGIAVCDEWRESFEAFLRDMGEAPEGLSIERVDNAKGYCKDNCVWKPLVEQQGNRRNNRQITLNGATKCLAAWCRDFGVDRRTVRSRIDRGWPVEQLFMPVDV